GTKIFRQQHECRAQRQYPDQNIIGPPHDGQPGRGTSTSRPATAYASTGNGHGHTMAKGDTASDPSPRPWPNEGGEGSLTPRHRQQNPGPPAAARPPTR